MKIQRKVSPTTIIEVEGATLAECFDAVAQAEEIFAQRTCGCCGKNQTAFTIRRDKEGNVYRLVVCKACSAEFRIGSRREPKGALYPRTRDPKTGKPLADGGWAIFRGGQRQPDDLEPEPSGEPSYSELPADF